MRPGFRPAPLRRAAQSLVIFVLISAGFSLHAHAQEGQAPATEATSPQPPWYQQVAFNAFLSASWSYNVNSPASRTNQFRVFDLDDASVRLDVAELVVQKTASKANDLGFRVDLTAGASIPRVTASAGLFRDDDGVAGDLDIHQIYATYVAPVGRGLKLDVGKFITPVGYEVIEGYDGYNDNASRSFLFGYAIPYTHTGVRVGYTFSDRVSALVFLANGWDNVVDNNRGKTLGAQLTLTPEDRTSLTAGYIVGPEQADNDSHMRQLLDLTISFKPVTSLTLGANVDLGRESGVALPESATGRPGVVQDVTWKGVAGYLRVAPSPRTALTLRAEWMDDPDGARTGVAQALREMTFTPEFRPVDHFVLRAELRHDWSSARVFETSGSDLKRTQTTVGLNAMFIF